MFYFKVMVLTVEQQIQLKLDQAFKPMHLQIENESHMHNVPKDSESHFKVVLVTHEFDALNKVKQHQAVYKVLAEELAGPVHALALHTFSPDAWNKASIAPDSPKCLGGNGK
jgi:BolA protein